MFSATSSRVFPSKSQFEVHISITLIGHECVFQEVTGNGSRSFTVITNNLLSKYEDLLIYIPDMSSDIAVVLCICNFIVPGLGKHLKNDLVERCIGIKEA